LQATGRDARGRKQYRYHKRWREVRDESKYRRTVAFAHSLAALRARVTTDLAHGGLTQATVVAAVVRLLDTTLARIGNESYARDNKSFGLTTLRTSHLKRDSHGLKLRFRGKSGVWHTIGIADRRIAAVIRRCHDLPGQELFTYLDSLGEPAAVTSDDVNAYVHAAMGSEFTAKDFRTWHGTVLCALELQNAGAVEGAVNRRRAVTEAVRAVATHLRNTPAVCRSSYVHPALIDRFILDGELRLPKAARGTSTGLAGDEARVLRLLEREVKRDERDDLRKAMRASVRRAKAARRSAGDSG
jgi:DNA topoisomerase I